MEIKEIALEIGNELIKTLDSRMPSIKADQIVKAQAERLLREIAGLKGSIKGEYSCIQFRVGGGQGNTDYKFVEE